MFYFGEKKIKSGDISVRFGYIISISYLFTVLRQIVADLAPKLVLVHSFSKGTNRNNRS